MRQNIPKRTSECEEEAQNQMVLIKSKEVLYKEWGPTGEFKSSLAVPAAAPAHRTYLDH